MSEADRVGSPLEALCQQVTTLTQAVQRLQDGYFQLEGRLQHLILSPGDATSTSPSGASSSQDHSSTAPAVVMTLPEPRVPTPERFSGNRKRFRAFKNACLLYLALQPKTFSSETVKVGFIIFLLSEEPQAWAHNLLEQKSPLLNSVETFFESMGRLYDVRWTRPTHSHGRVHLTYLSPGKKTGGGLYGRISEMVRGHWME